MKKVIGCVSQSLRRVVDVRRALRDISLIRDVQYCKLIRAVFSLTHKRAEKMKQHICLLLCQDFLDIPTNTKKQRGTTLPNYNMRTNNFGYTVVTFLHICSFLLLLYGERSW